jgi:hypothetical protein
VVRSADEGIVLGEVPRMGPAVASSAIEAAAQEASAEAAEVAGEVFLGPLFTSFFIPSLELCKMVFNNVLPFYNMIAYRE